MSPFTPQPLAQTRIANADALLRNEVDLRTYPHRHLALVARPGFTSSGVTQLMEAVEYLSHYGWELVNVTSVNRSDLVYAFMRRR
ncbi:hypothetical protein ACFY2R_04920 [Micromonospora olivasterospora]|uniref:Uncharacterized protein n=1 Tax=Micromonospora olivasterospora TaxID=1880 RepID=A0A562I8L0_MICOL|nr:hypothetical protein [Micromonospora olivasterospora]TWH67370.1 hypothetical protein JD77_02345 [Micromonospora olivasterospora]